MTILSFETGQDIRNALQNNTKSTEDIYFPVETVPLQALYGGDTTPLSEHVGIYRPDTGDVIAVHKKGYNLVPNDQVFPKFEEALYKSQINTKNMQVVDSVAYAGGRTIRSYVFPEERVEISTGDEMDLRLVVQNSYDGSCAFSSMVGAFRLVCANGMIIGEKFAQQYGKHTKNLNISNATGKVNAALEVYASNAKEWGTWIDTIITDAQAQSVISAIPGINDRLSDKIFAYWVHERSTLGPTKWALFNALTYWSTHAGVKPSSVGNTGAIVVDREARIRRTIASQNFQKLAA